MIRVELAPFVVTFPDLESARDFMILASGAQRLVKLGPVGVRRLEPPRTDGPKSLDEIADKHARVPVRIAEPRAPASANETTPETTEPVVPREPRPRRRARSSPLMEHVTSPEPEGEYARVALPHAGNGERAKPADAPAPEPHAKRPTLEDLQEHVLAAFAADEAYPIPALAAELFGESTGRTVQKTRLLIEQLIGRKKLERRGVATFRVLEHEQDRADEEGEDEPDDEDWLGAGGDPDLGEPPLGNDDLDAVASS